METQLVRTAATISHLKRTARDALRAVRELERVMDTDSIANYRVEAGEEINNDMLDEVAELLHLARSYCPGQELELVVIAHIAPRQEARNGTGTVQHHSAG